MGTQSQNRVQNLSVSSSFIEPIILFKQKFSFANIIIVLDFAVLSVMRRSHRARGADPVAMFAWAI